MKLLTRINPLTGEGALRALVDFTLSDARRIYSSIRNPLALKELSHWPTSKMHRQNAIFLTQRRCALLTLPY